MYSLQTLQLLNEIKYSKKTIKNIQTSFNKINLTDRLKVLMFNTEQNYGLQKLNYQLNYPSFMKKGNPFFFIRKNYKKLFRAFLKKSFFTPNLLKFLHMAYWPKNDYKNWRMFYIYHGLELKQRKNIQQSFISNLSYFFSLIFKKSYINNFLNLTSKIKLKNNYFKKLSYFYKLILNKTIKFKSRSKKSTLIHLKLKFKLFTQKQRKKFIQAKSNISNFISNFNYFKISKFIMKNRIKKDFKLFFLLTFRQKSFLKNIVNFYFPVIAINIKETAIHSLPMKTKKPRRV